MELCTSVPLSLGDIADIVKRKPASVRSLYVNPLIKSEKLFFTIPEMINHPDQKYATIENK